MHIFSRAISVTLGASFILSALQASTPGAPLALDPKVARSMMVPSLVSYSSSPEAGIKLLEEIYQKCSQLALGKTKPLLIAQTTQQKQSVPSQNQLDWMLAIKPPTAKTRKAVHRVAPAKAAPQIAMIDEADKLKQTYRGGLVGDAVGGSTDNFKGAPQQQAVDLGHADGSNNAMYYRSHGQYQLMDDRPVTRDFKEPAASAGKNKDEKRQVANDEEKNERAIAAATPSAARFDYTANKWKQDSPQERRGFQQLSKSLTNLATAAGTMQGEMQSMDAISSNANSSTMRGALMAHGANNISAKKTAYAKPAARERAPMAISTGEGTAEYQPADATLQTRSVGGSVNGTGIGGGFGQQAQSVPVPAAPALASIPQSALNAPAADTGSVVLEQPSKFKYMHEYPSSPPQQALKLAQVVPTVISGIPLVRLGANAADATKALRRTRGATSEQQLQNWTVWSAKKPGSQDTAVQLYIQHGMVGAMRVFDKSLIPADLGVGLGDELQAVKSRFGEPAFIITEADKKHGGGIGGRNYVYPMSQVSFQIARVNNRPEPQVVSLMIFNVNDVK